MINYDFLSYLLLKTLSNPKVLDNITFFIASSFDMLSNSKISGILRILTSSF